MSPTHQNPRLVLDHCSCQIKYIPQKSNPAQVTSKNTSRVLCFTCFIDFDNAVIRNLLEEAKKRNFMEAEARKHVIGSNALDNDRCGGERR
jgi:hypothetical protein